MFSQRRKLDVPIDVDILRRRSGRLGVIAMKLLRLMCFFLAISLPGSGFVQAQTIADVARQERERRKALESETSERIPVVTSVTPAPTTASTSVTTAVMGFAREPGDIAMGSRGSIGARSS